MVEVTGPPLPELAPAGLPSVEDEGATPGPEGDVDPLAGTAEVLGEAGWLLLPAPVGWPVEGEEVGAKLMDRVAPLAELETGAVVADEEGEDAVPLAGTAAVPLGEDAPPEAGADAVVE